ncbi:MAG: tetratricopeptide repeat protein [Candidatus Eremiobacteraeota bacterium]|nr:tetratricopeptide repeat protein [Candidatus Eremiobacteraeota bacterium]
MTFTRIVALGCTMAMAATTVPALAQVANEFSIAKVMKVGTSSQPISGSGTVKVQVQVNADGSHKAMKVISSTNPGDNAAAMEIAQNSSYRPAHRGTTPITSFYDFELKFNGKSVSHTEQGGGGGAPSALAGAPSSVTGPIDAAIRAHQYDTAISKANAALVSSPGNPAILQLLGIAQYYNKDYPSAAATFSKVDTIGKEFQPLAADAFASASVQESQTNPSTALDYAQKAVGLANNSNSQFALGVAQLANKQYPQAITTLKAVHDKTTDPKTKVAIDRQLLSAYLATNDTAGANATTAEMKQLDPTGGSATTAVGSHYIQLGNDAMTAKNYDDALKDYDQAAATGDPKVTVTANTGAAFAILSMQKPDYQKAQSYAAKAVAAAPNDPQANYAAGVSMVGIYANSKKASDKQQALDFLNKADQAAKAAGNTALALQIENQIKNIPQ